MSDRLAHLQNRWLYRAFYEHDLTPGVISDMRADEPRLEWVLANLGPEDDVLEVGCHKGEMTRYLSFHTEGRLVALDISVGSVSIGRIVYDGIPIHWLTGDAEALPIRDSSFDAVVLAEVLEHVPDPAAAIREAERVVRPGGRVIVSVPRDAIAMEQAGRKAADRQGAYPLDSHVREYLPAVELVGKRNLRLDEGSLSNGLAWHLAAYTVDKG